MSAYTSSFTGSLIDNGIDRSINGFDKWIEISGITSTLKKIIDRGNNSGVIFFFQFWDNVCGIACYNYNGGNPEVVVVFDSSGGYVIGTGLSHPDPYLVFTAYNDGVYVNSNHFSSSNTLKIMKWN